MDVPKPLRLLLALDSKFESLASVSLTSFLIHNQVEKIVAFTPIDNSLKILPKIAECLGVEFIIIVIEQDSPISSLSMDVKPYFYCIEAISSVCQSESARYLYLDSDTLCIRCINDLSLLALSSNKPLAACSHGRPMQERSLLLDLPSPYHYFNAGVILFESHMLAPHLDIQTLINYYKANKILCRFREQCSLNAFMCGKVQFLPNHYNYLSWMRPRLGHLYWHKSENNLMANSLSDIQKRASIVHLSSGGIPLRLSPELLEDVDLYWIKIYESVKTLSDFKYLLELPTYEEYRSLNAHHKKFVKD